MTYIELGHFEFEATYTTKHSNLQKKNFTLKLGCQPGIHPPTHNFLFPFELLSKILIVILAWNDHWFHLIIQLQLYKQENQVKIWRGRFHEIIYSIKETIHYEYYCFLWPIWGLNSSKIIWLGESYKLRTKPKVVILLLPT